MIHCIRLKSYDCAVGTECSDPDGYRGAVFDGRYVYFVPDNNGGSDHGEVLRYDTFKGTEIPTVSHWGLFISALCVLAVGTIMFGRHRTEISSVSHS